MHSRSKQKEPCVELLLLLLLAAAAGTLLFRALSACALRDAGHQGEENSGQPNDYECFQSAMIADWRQTFAAHGSPPDVPFVFVQLQPCGIPPAMRYAQAQALTANSGL